MPMQTNIAESFIPFFQHSFRDVQPFYKRISGILHSKIMRNSIHPSAVSKVWHHCLIPPPFGLDQINSREHACIRRTRRSRPSMACIPPGRRSESI